MFGSVTNCMNEKDMLRGCLTLLGDMPKVVVFSSVSYQGKPYKDDGSRKIAKKIGAHIIETDTPDQAEMRNLGIGYLKSIGIEYAFIVDTDEWWAHEAVTAAKEFIQNEPFEAYHKKMFNMFKRPSWYVASPNDRGTCVAIRTDKKIVKPRAYDGQTKEIKGNERIYHFSYVRTPEKILEKITNFSHAPEVDPMWYENIFLKCTPEFHNVHPTVGNAWPDIEIIGIPDYINDLLPHYLWSA